MEFTREGEEYITMELEDVDGEGGECNEEEDYDEEEDSEDEDDEHVDDMMDID